MSLRRIVVTGKSAEIQQLARQVAQEAFAADDPDEALDITETVNPDLILLDHKFDFSDIRDFIVSVHENFPNVPIVVVGDNDEKNPTAEYKQLGACEYLRGKRDYSRLEEIIRQIQGGTAATNSESGTDRFFAAEYAASAGLVGHSVAMLDTLRMIRLVATSQCNPVLILGETGTGKELAARAIHILRHPNEHFVAVNCAALTSNLLESELFGHVKGSFTGADREKTGLFELTGSGTIFLDEISEMPPELQAKLLRVLQEKTFRKVGGLKDTACNATIIATSNRNLKSEVRAKRFRADLYYRLNICPVRLAPLRSAGRRPDIALLAEYFLKTSTICPEKVNKPASLTKLAIEVLERHDWPGNVRELRNTIEKAILLETTDKIGLSSVLFDPLDYDEQSENPTPQQQDKIKDFSLEKAERELIARALRETGWQKTQAAALLGITRATLYAKVKQYNIEKNPLLAPDPFKPSQSTEVPLPSLT